MSAFDLVIVAAWLGGAAWVAYDAHERNKNPWAWGGLMVVTPVYGPITWFAVWWQLDKRRANRIAEQVQRENRITREAIARSGRSVSVREATHGKASLPTAYENPGYVRGTGSLTNATLKNPWQSSDGCLNCGNRDVCYRNEVQIQEHWDSWCQDYQRDASLRPENRGLVRP
jgi:hypothetical protein